MLDLTDVLDPGAGLPRTHLVDRISARDAGRLVTVTGPAGSGKTELLMQCAAAAAAQPNQAVAWFRARPEENTAQGVYRGIDQAVCKALNATPPSNTSAEELAGRLNDSPRSVTVFVDDEHNLHKAEAQHALSRVIELAGHRTRFVLGRRFAGSRSMISVGESGTTTEIRAEDLRFTGVEVARLFTEYFAEELPSSAVADLTVVTGGWITGLHLFQQCTTGTDPERRSEAVTGLWRSSELLRHYLDRNVLDAMPPQISQLLIHSSLLPTLTAELCDSVLRTTGSAAILRWLADRGLFIREFTSDCFRLDDFFREYLIHRLTEEAGHTRIRNLQLRTAMLLESHGLWREAFRNYSELGDWSAGTRVLGDSGIATDTARAVTLRLPEDRGLFEEHAGWSAVARARKRLSFGDLEGAAGLQRSAAQHLSNPFDREMLRAELMRTQTWTARSAVPAAGTHLDWAVALRQLVGSGQCDAPALTGAAGGWHLVSAMSALISGRIDDVVTHLRAADAPDNTFVPIAARTALAAITAITDPSTPSPDWTSLRTDANAAGFPWLGRICLALEALNAGDQALHAPAVVRKACESDGDSWGALICDLITVIAAPDPKTRDEALSTGALKAESLGARHLSQCIRSLGDALEWDRENLGEEAGSDRNSAKSPQPMTLEPVSLPPAIPSGSIAPVSDALADESAVLPSVVIRCFGTFSLRLDGEPADGSQLRPRARSLLRYLAAHAGRPVHEETLMEEFWSALPMTSARHNLHVAISAIRRFLDRHRPSRPSLLVRRGETYVLQLPAGSSCDLADFEAAVQRCRQSITSVTKQSTAARPGETDRITNLRTALSLYQGHLLEDEGPLDWLSGERLRLQAVAVKLCVELAAAELSAGDIDAAVDACHRGIEIDRMNDACWRLLIEAQESRGDFASARRSRTNYDAILADLGINC